MFALEKMDWGKCVVNHLYSKGAQQKIVPSFLIVLWWMEWYVSASKVGTGFLDRKILMVDVNKVVKVREECKAIYE